MKKILLLFILLLNGVCSNAQQAPRTITLNDTSYFVYPFRAEPWGLDVPPCGLKLQDGRYVALNTYHFKERKHKKPVLIDKDTNSIAIVFSIVNNVPEGAARFYSDYRLNPGAGNSKLSQWYQCGYYKNGLKTGKWIYKTDKNVQTEYYKEGLKDGPSTWKKTGPNILNASYHEGKQVGRSYLYDDKGKLAEIHYHDSLGIRDTSITFENGKLSMIQDILMKPLKRDEEYLFSDPSQQSIWYRILIENSVFSNYSAENSFSFLKEYDKDGKLVTNILLESDTSYVFDSLLVNDRLIKVKTMPCEPGSKAKTCYMVEEYNKEYGHHNQKYYVGNRAVKGIFINGLNSSKKGAMPDTTYDTYYEVDTTINPWLTQITEKSIYKGKVSYTRYIPALQYWFYSKPELYSLYFAPLLEPAFVDSVNKFACFRDTTYILKTHVTVATQSYTKPYSVDVNSRSFFVMNYQLLNPIALIGLQQHMIGDLISKQDQYEGNTLNTYFPEQVLYMNKPYQGKAFYSYYKKDKYAKGLLRLNNRTFASGGSIQGRGSYLHGLKEGDWEFIDNDAHVGAESDFKKMYETNKNVDTYYTASFKNGYLNGPMNVYETYRIQKWEFPDPLDNQKTFKYLSEKRNYVNDSLHGPVEIYNRRGQLLTRANYNMDKLDGPAFRYSNGKVVYEAMFKDNELHGELREYDYSEAHHLMTRATFYKNKINGLVEMFDTTKWLEVKADTGILRYKKIFYENGTLKEHIVLNAGQRYRTTEPILSSYNFFEYAAMNPIAGRPRRRVIRQTCTGGVRMDIDSANVAQFDGTYKNYYNTGQLYCEGPIENMKPAGTWKFYNEVGALIHHVAFRDSSFRIPGDTSLVKSIGILTGYYFNGKPRCRAFVTGVDVSYDCNTKNDLSAFEMVLIDCYDFFGKENCVNGTGPVKQYNENGALQAAGQLKNYIKVGLWRYYDPNQKLKMMGHYVNNQPDGVWYEGDLEGINYEDAACFDPNNPYALKKYKESLKDLKIEKRIYKNGELIDSEEHYIDMNRD